jgi:hypothetical protein
MPTSVENSKFEFDIHQLLVGKGSRKTYRAIFTIKDSVVHILALLTVPR